MAVSSSFSQSFSPPSLIAFAAKSLCQHWQHTLLQSISVFQILVFFHAHFNHLERVTNVAIIHFSTCACVYLVWGKTTMFPNILQLIAAFGIVACQLPIIVQLTESISSDTIGWMVVGLFTVFVVNHSDFTISRKDKPIAFNAGIFGTICLASRLQSLPSLALYSFLWVCFSNIFLLPDIYHMFFSKPQSTNVSIASLLFLQILWTTFLISTFGPPSFAQLFWE
eukprot:m.35500 g.35500  ORF g.35500 m.35500 type:complete len:224 (-) comp6608_c0_seq1:3107-3778(-)